MTEENAAKKMRQLPW